MMFGLWNPVRQNQKISQLSILTETIAIRAWNALNFCFHDANREAKQKLDLKSCPYSEAPATPQPRDSEEDSAEAFKQHQLLLTSL